MVTSSPRPGRAAPSSSGQHFLKSGKFAGELVEASAFHDSDLVLEVGAGKGKITQSLSTRAHKVLAVEKDPRLANLLIERFRGSNVIVVMGDFLDLPLPAQHFRVFGNVPFGITSALLRTLLDDPATSLVRADLIVQRGAALKRVRPSGSNLLNLSWGPWWTFRISSWISARAFEPMPSVDAAMLSIVRRDPTLLDHHERARYVHLLHSAFEGNRELRSVLRRSMSAQTFQRVSSRLGFAPDARANELSLEQWVALFRVSAEE